MVAATAAAAVAVFGPPIEGAQALPLPVVVLLAAAAAAWVLPGRAGGGIAVAVILFVIGVSIEPLGTDLTGGRGPLLAVVRSVEVVGLVVAGYASVRRLAQPPTRAGRRRPGWARPVQVLGLLALCGIGAELLSAYDDSTGDPGGIAFALIFFGALYGAPALLARDLVRRLGWGWPSMVLLFAALGTAQACLIDQSMFSASYQGYAGWEETREATLLPALGISAVNAFRFVVGHVIFSFAAPVALAEGWIPRRAKEPWLGQVGTPIAVISYLAAAAMIISDPASRSANPIQLGVSAGIVIAFIAAAALVGRARSGAAEPTAPKRLPIWVVLMVASVVALVSELGGEDWLGLAFTVVATGAVGVGIVVAARVRGWSIRHSAAVALAFLMVRGLLAFSYFPLIGEVEPLPKYVHNTVMVAVVILAGIVAFRRPSPLLAHPMADPRSGPPTSHPGSPA